mgnify:CR=1 FL=1
MRVLPVDRLAVVGLRVTEGFRVVRLALVAVLRVTLGLLTFRAVGLRVVGLRAGFVTFRVVEGFRGVLFALVAVLRVALGLLTLRAGVFRVEAFFCVVERLEVDFDRRWLVRLA